MDVMVGLGDVAKSGSVDGRVWTRKSTLSRGEASTFARFETA